MERFEEGRSKAQREEERKQKAVEDRQTVEMEKS